MSKNDLKMSERQIESGNKERKKKKEGSQRFFSEPNKNDDVREVSVFKLLFFGGEFIFSLKMFYLSKLRFWKK